MNTLYLLLVAVVSLAVCEKLNYRTASPEQLEAAIGDTKRRLQELRLKMEEGERRLQAHLDSVKEFSGLKDVSAEVEMVNRITINTNKDMRALARAAKCKNDAALVKERKATLEEVDRLHELRRNSDLATDEAHAHREAGMNEATFNISFLFGDKTTSLITSHDIMLDAGPVSLSPLPLDDGALNQEFEALNEDDTVGELQSPTVDEDPVGELESPTVDEPVFNTGWNTMSEAVGGASLHDLKGSDPTRPLMWVVLLQVAASTAVAAIRVFGRLYVQRFLRGMRGLLSGSPPEDCFS